MIYNLENTIEAKKAKLKLESLINSGKQIELKEKRQKRTIKQNSYMHVCIALFGIEFGYDLTESKTLLKRLCPFMIYEKNGNKFLKKTSKMETDSLTQFIDWIRNYAGKQGLYIPNSEEYLQDQNRIDREIKINQKYQ